MVIISSISVKPEAGERRCIGGKREGDPPVTAASLEA
jgi:hypothetical protein